MLASEGLIRASFVDPGLGEPRRHGTRRPAATDRVRLREHVRRHPLRVRPRRTGTSSAPSIAVFEPGFLQVVLAYHEAGALPPGTLVKLYFAAGGYLTRGRPLWGVPPIPEGLDLYLAMLGGHRHPVGGRGRRRRRVRRHRSPSSRSSAAGTSASGSRTTRTRPSNRDAGRAGRGAVRGRRPPGRDARRAETTCSASCR